MHRRYFEGSDQRLARAVQRKLLKVKLSSLAQIGQGFWDTFPLCRRTRLWIQRDETAFLGRNQNGG